MTAITDSRPFWAPIPLSALLLAALAVGAMWLVTFEGGVISEAIGRAGTLHEFFHDGRHLLGVPCH